MHSSHQQGSPPQACIPHIYWDQPTCIPHLIWEHLQQCSLTTTRIPPNLDPSHHLGYPTSTMHSSPQQGPCPTWIHHLNLDPPQAFLSSSGSIPSMDPSQQMSSPHPHMHLPQHLGHPNIHSSHQVGSPQTCIPHINWDPPSIHSSHLLGSTHLHCSPHVGTPPAWTPQSN